MRDLLIWLIVLSGYAALTALWERVLRNRARVFYSRPLGARRLAFTWALAIPLMVLGANHLDQGNWIAVLCFALALPVAAIASLVC